MMRIFSKVSYKVSVKFFLYLVVRYFYIYKTTNKIDNKIYIGKRITTTNYENDGYLGSGMILQSIIEKYGREVLQKEILELCKDKIELEERERFWISFYNSTDIKVGYNLTEGGTGGPTNQGKRFSEEWKQNISVARKNQGNTENHRLAKLRPEYKENQSKASKLSWLNNNIGKKRKKTYKEQEEKGIVRKTNKGFKQSDEVKKSISEKLSIKVKCVNVEDNSEIVYDSISLAEKELNVAVFYYIDTDKLFKKKFSLKRIK